MKIEAALATDRFPPAPRKPRSHTTKAARWLDLIAYLLSHRFPVTREQIFENVAGYLDSDKGSPSPVGRGGHGVRSNATAAMEGSEAKGNAVFESARRKFERDKDELRTLGIDIETAPLPVSAGDEPQTGYRLKPAGFYLPTFEITPSPVGRGGRGVRSKREQTNKPYPALPRLDLTEAEVAVLDRATRRLAERTEFPLSAAAASARKKLAFDLPFDETTMERVLAAPLAETGRRALEVLQGAVMDRVPVACTYFAPSRNREERREIEPYGLFFQWSHWYCVARARDRAAVRLFRVDRMRDAAKLDQAPFPVPDDFDIRAWLGRAPWEFGDQPAVAVQVRFNFPESRWVLNQRIGRVVDPMLEDAAALLAFEVRDRAAFLRWLLTFRRQATVVTPADIAEELEGLRRRVAALYEPDLPAPSHG